MRVGTMVLDPDVGTVDHVDELQGAVRGGAIKRRREEMLWDKKALANRAGISRDTLDRVEADADGVTDRTYRRVEHALDDLAEELGFTRRADTSDHDVVRIEVTEVPGAAAIAVQGHVDNLPALEQAIARILKAAQESGGANDDTA